MRAAGGREINVALPPLPRPTAFLSCTVLGVRRVFDRVPRESLCSRKAQVRSQPKERNVVVFSCFGVSVVRRAVRLLRSYHTIPHSHLQPLVSINQSINQSLSLSLSLCLLRARSVIVGRSNCSTVSRLRFRHPCKARIKHHAILYVASCRGHETVARLLLDRGANVDDKSITNMNERWWHTARNRPTWAIQTRAAEREVLPHAEQYRAPGLQSAGRRMVDGQVPPRRRTASPACE